MQNSLYVQVLRSPILAALLHGTRAVRVSQTLRRVARKGLRNFRSSLAPHIFRRAAITLGTGPYSSLLYTALFLFICIYLFVSLFMVVVITNNDFYYHAITIMTRRLTVHITMLLQ